MKAIATLLIICVMGCFIACTGQMKQSTPESNKLAVSKKDTTTKQLNLLDEQTKVFTQIFDLAGAGEDNPLGDATNFQELINTMDLPEAQKEMLREQYKVYDLSLDPSKKDSLKLMVDKMLTKAIEKSQSEQ